TGPSWRCTSIAQPIIFSVKGSRSSGNSRLILSVLSVPLWQKLVFFVFNSLHPFCRATGTEPAIDERIQVAVHDRLHIARLHASAQIFHHPVRLKYITANLVAPGDTPLLPVKAFHLRLRCVHALGVNQ